MATKVKKTKLSKLNNILKSVQLDDDINDVSINLSTCLTNLIICRKSWALLQQGVTTSIIILFPEIPTS